MLEGFPPEIFPIIASYFPLHSCQSSLLSLALTSKHFCDVVIPDLLYRLLVLRTESDALSVLQKLLPDRHDSDSLLGHCVRGLHIMSELSDASQREESIDVLRLLEKVVASGRLPCLESLTIHLADGWYYNEVFTSGLISYEPVKGFGRLEKPFWRSLAEHCPRLRALALQGLVDDNDDPWVAKSGIFEIQGLTSLVLDIGSGYDSAHLINIVLSLSSRLETLALSFHPNHDDILGADFFPLTLPHLRCLNLRTYFGVNNPAQALDFWARHPNLESLDLRSSLGDRWFPDHIPPGLGLLPNLMHLKTSFSDFLGLAPIVGSQLISLNVWNSVNAQIPYVLQTVFSDGLPRLQSLVIAQHSSNKRRDIDSEGALWYETADGRFCEIEQKYKHYKAGRKINSLYMCSISRAAPNLEEIAFHMHLSSFRDFIPSLASFQRLRRVCYWGANSDQMSTIAIHHDKLLDDARELALVSASCDTLTDVTGACPYATAQIFRNHDGEIAIHKKLRWGMVIGREDEPFPQSRC